MIPPSPLTSVWMLWTRCCVARLARGAASRSQCLSPIPAAPRNISLNSLSWRCRLSSGARLPKRRNSATSRSASSRAARRRNCVPHSMSLTHRASQPGSSTCAPIPAACCRNPWRSRPSSWMAAWCSTSSVVMARPKRWHRQVERVLTKHWLCW